MKVLKVKIDEATQVVINIDKLLTLVMRSVFYMWFSNIIKYFNILNKNIILFLIKILS